MAWAAAGTRRLVSVSGKSPKSFVARFSSPKQHAIVPPLTIVMAGSQMSARNRPRVRHDNADALSGPQALVDEKGPAIIGDIGGFAGVKIALLIEVDPDLDAADTRFKEISNAVAVLVVVHRSPKRRPDRRPGLAPDQDLDSRTHGRTESRIECR